MLDCPASTNTFSGPGSSDRALMGNSSETRQHTAIGCSPPNRRREHRKHKSNQEAFMENSPVGEQIRGGLQPRDPLKTRSLDSPQYSRNAAESFRIGPCRVDSKPG